MRFRGLSIILILLLTCTSCTLFFGNIKPSELKSTDYQIADLAKMNPSQTGGSHWEKLNRPGSPSVNFISNPESGPLLSLKDKGDANSGVADMSFQETRTHSIVSVNSSCKNYDGAKITESLSELTQALLLGIYDKKNTEEKTLTVSGVPALETTVQGRMDTEEVFLRTVVLTKGICVYDLLFIGKSGDKSGNFEEEIYAFSQFVSSLHLK